MSKLCLISKYLWSLIGGTNKVTIKQAKNKQTETIKCSHDIRSSLYLNNIHTYSLNNYNAS